MIFPKILQQVGVKLPPESIIDAAACHASIEFQLGPPFKSMPLFKRWPSVFGQWDQHRRAIGEKKGIANIKENDASLGHDSTLQGLKIGGQPTVIVLNFYPNAVKLFSSILISGHIQRVSDSDWPLTLVSVTKPHERM
jgi:hypothetical protein